MRSIMKKGIVIKDIAVEWDGGIVRGFRSKHDAERFIRYICKKNAPNLEYHIYTYY